MERDGNKNKAVMWAEAQKHWVDEVTRIMFTKLVTTKKEITHVKDPEKFAS